MPQYCAVPGCNESKGGHQFPSDKNILQLWLEAIRRPEYNPPHYARVCKKHFAPEDYGTPKDSFADICIPDYLPRARLRGNVVPSRFPWNQDIPDTEENKAFKRQCAEKIIRNWNKEETVFSTARINKDTKNATTIEVPVSCLKLYKKEFKRQSARISLQRQNKKATAVSTASLNSNNKNATAVHVKCAERALQDENKKETVVSTASIDNNNKNGTATQVPESSIKVYSYNKTQPVSGIKGKVKKYYKFDEVCEDININLMLSVEM